jgi:hypothetical protein
MRCTICPKTKDYCLDPECGLTTGICNPAKVAVLIPPPTSEQKPKGLYGKYIIQKANGKPIDPEAEFFVLRLDPLGEMNHVKACRKAVQVYANEIEPFIPELAKDLKERYPIDSTEQKEESQDKLWMNVIILVGQNIDRQGSSKIIQQLEERFTITRR